MGAAGVAAIEGLMKIIEQGVNVGGSILSAKLSNKWAMDNWLKQQEYNTPLNQRLRLEEAGLNPALMYSQGGVSNVATTAPDTTGPSFKSFDGLSSALSVYMQMKQLENQTMATQSDAQLKAAQSLTEEQKQAYYASMAQKNDWYVHDYGPSLIDYTNERTTYTENQIRWMEPYMLAKIDFLNASTDQKYALIDRYSALNELTRSQNAYCLKQISIAKEYIITATAEAEYAYTHNYLRMMNSAQHYNLQTAKVYLTRLQAMLTRKDVKWYEVQKVVEDLQKLVDTGMTIYGAAKGAPKYNGPWRASETEYYGPDGEFRGSSRTNRQFVPPDNTYNY